MQPEGTYMFSDRTGNLSLVNTQVKNVYSIFIYPKGGILDLVEGMSPLIFNTKEDLTDFLATGGGRKDVPSWLDDDNATVVIRKFRCLVP